jgi:hypothetical protein
MKNTTFAVSVLALFTVGGFLLGYATSFRQQPTTLKTEVVFKPRRYFLVNWSWNNHTGDFGYSTSNGLYPQRDSMEAYIHSAFGEPRCVIHFITEVNESDYNQWFKGHNK